jgi:peptidoglycan/LPS O-acetylase OafA/YrhL
VRFRSDVDGLRAVAVLLVVLYHAKVRPVTAGYVGVDVFLVISGFLITGILVSEIERRQFSATTFLRRRMRRLTPAAVVAVAATLLASLCFLGPRDLKTLAGSSVAVLGLGANFFFWRREGYFQEQVPEQPLLHTWSLGLEEQYYLVFPAFLILIWRFAPRYRVPALAVAAIAFLGLSALLTPFHPGAAFYLLPARAWEFLLGGLIAVTAARWAISGVLAEVLAGAGMLAILVSAVALSRATPYPGIAALLPAAGATLLIWAGGQRQTLVGRALSARVLVIVGAMSYSLYLWHWPILSLARYYLGRDLVPPETLMALAAIGLVSYGSWRYVERPFRLGTDAAAQVRSVTPIVVLAGGILLTAAVTVAGNGLPARLPEQALVFDRAGQPEAAAASPCLRTTADRLSKDAPCLLTASNGGRERILLWGDSHANAVAPAMASLGALTGQSVWQASYSSCPPVLGVSVAHMSPSHECAAFNSLALAAVDELRITRVLLVAYWTAYLPQPPDPALARLLDPYSRTSDLGGGDDVQNKHNLASALRQTVRALAAKGVDVWILRDVPAQDGFVPLILSRAVSLGHDYNHLGITLIQHRQAQSRVDALLNDSGSMHMLDPASVLCASGTCLTGAAGQALYIDSNHLSEAGAALIRPLLEPLFR